MAIDIGPKIGIDGEREFRQSIANINQQIKTMDSEMRAAAAAFDRSNDAEGKNSATKKILTEQIEAQRRKLDLLQDALEKSATKYGENDTKTLKWRQAVADATTALSKMEGELDDVGDELDDTGDELADAEKKTSSFGDTAKGVFVGGAILDGIKAMGAAIKSLMNYGADVITSTAEVGDQIDKQSQKLGISRKEYQQLSYALEMYGANVDGLQTGLKTLAVQAQKGSDAFDKLGLSQEFVKSASTEDLFEAVIGQLQGMAEGTERTAIANTLLGKSATELQPLLNDTQKNFAAIKNAAPLMSDATVDASAAMQDSMTAFQSTMTEIKSEVAGRVMPAITKALDTARKKLQTGEARKAIDKAGKALGDVAAKVVTFAANALPKLVKLVESAVKNWDKWALAIGGVVLAWKGFAIVKTVTQSINAAKVAFAGLNAVMSANPIGAVLSAIGLLIGLLSALVLTTDDAAESLDELSEEEQAVVDAADRARDSFEGAVQTFTASADAISENTQRTKDLWAELQTLAGETGHVSDKDRERAAYILGELNEALGTEYEMTGNQIQQYQDMRKAIDDLIKVKQANALLDASTAAYQSAVEGRSAMEAQLVQDQIAYDEAKKFYEEQEEALAQEIARIKNDKDSKYYGATDERIRAHLLSIVGADSEWRDRITDAKAAMDDAEAAYGKTADELGTMLNTMTNYSEAQKLIAEGNYDSAVRKLNAINGALWDAYDEGTVLTEKEEDALKKSLDYRQRLVTAYERERARGTAGYSKEIIDGERKRLGEWQNLYDSQKNAWIRRGADIAGGIADGIGQKSSFARNKVQGILGDVITAVDNARNPARKAGEQIPIEFGAGITAFSNRAVENSAKMAAAVIKHLDCVEQATEMGQYIAQGLADGMTSQQKYVTSKTDKLVNELLFGIKDTAQIASPSKVTKSFGRFIMQGLPAGMEAEMPRAMASVHGMTGEILDALRISAPVNALAYAGSGVAAGAAQPSYTTNMGGITINMSVAAPNVSNVNDLAGLVSDRIRDAIINAQQARR